MKVFSDLHLHSRFARGCSTDLTIANIAKWAAVKGVSLVGTGDFTHPGWFEELKEQLSEIDDSGIYQAKNSQTRFILQTEISLIYTQGDRGYRVHLVVLAPDFVAVEQITEYLKKHGRVDYDGRPIFKIPCPKFVEDLRQIDERIEIFPAHIWTPWFSMFGDKSGFDSVKECFQDQAKNIHAIETGISSDPQMNWRLSQLDKFNIVSFSDSHSFWPWRFGREQTVFNLRELSFNGISKSFRTLNDKIDMTIEFWPSEGKYHFTGHRNCSVCLSPKDSLKLNNICPVCRKKLTVGVAQRVEQLADRPEGFSDNNRPKFKTLIPLSELISAALGVSASAKKTWGFYNILVEKFGNEMNVLLDADEKELEKTIDNKRIIKLIMMNRTEKIDFKPGYDGV
ncbi:MAG: endonuclease Q family protein [Candidatus Woesearchaeota archaeon]